MKNSSARMRTGFTFYRSFSDAIRLLSSRDQLVLFHAIADYALDQRQPDIDKFSKTARICWVTILPNLDANIARYNNGCKPKTTASEAKPKRSRSKHEADSITDDNVNDNEDVDVDVERVSVQDKPADTLTPQSFYESFPDKSTSDNSSSKSSSSRSRRFTPPSIDEVRDYISSNGLTADAAQFIDYYTSNNWMVGRNKMRDWQAALRNWARRDTGTAAFSLSLKIADNEPRPLYQAL